MAKTVNIKYDINDIVWWRTRGKSYSGKITSTEIVIDRFGTRVNYTVLVDEAFTGYDFYETINEQEIYKVERKQEQEPEK